MSINNETGRAMFADAGPQPQSIGPGCEAAGLKSILTGIADQIADADRRHSAALGDMQARLASLTKSAQGLRRQLPEEMSRELDRIEGSMATLSQKLAKADEASKAATAASTPVLKAALDRLEHAGAGAADEQPAPLKSVLSSEALGSLTRRDESARKSGMAEVDRFDVVDFDEPWDAAAADALARLYDNPDADASQLAAGPSETAVNEEAASEMGERGELQDSVPASAATTHQVQAVVPLVGDLAQAIAAGSAAQAAAMEQEREWLEGRFAEIAERLDKSLAGMQSDGAVNELNSRFARLEESLAVAMAGAVTREDVSGLKIIETQVEDLTAQLVTVQTHFSRLDTIELELRALAERISEDRLAKMLDGRNAEAPDMSVVADVIASKVTAQLPQLETALRSIAAEISEQKLGAVMQQIGQSRPNEDEMARRVAEQLAPQLSMARGGDVAGAERMEELRALVQEFVAERRNGDMQTNTMLDTMQQAMIRLLDRMDALESGQLVSEVEEAEAEADSRYLAHSQARDLEEMEREPIAYRRQANGPDIQVAAPVLPERRTSGFLAGSAPVEARGGGHRLAGSDLPEDAGLETAAQQSRTEPPRLGEPGKEPVAGDQVSREDFIAAARRAARQASASPPEAVAEGEEAAQSQAVEAKPAKGAKAKSKAKTKSSGSSSGLRVALLCLLAAGAGFMVFKSTILGGVEDLMQSQSGAKAPAASSSTPAKAKPANGGAAAPDSKSELLDADEERKGKSSQAPAGLPAFDGQKALIAPASTGETGGALQPIDGAAAMASLVQDGPGAVSSIYGSPNGGMAPAVPAALTPGSVQGGPAFEPATGSLPPATIGPYSLRHAAAKGQPAAQFEIAARFAEGRGVQQNLKEAVGWYQRAASKGYAPAQYRLASMFERGFGVKADIERAKLWYQRAAEQGVVKAMHNLAVLSSGRGGTAPSYDVATRWFTQAAEHGLIDSQFNLAIMYDSGLGVARDPAQAYRWFSIAARGGDAEASRRRDSIRTKLDSARVATIDSEVAAWRPRVADSKVNDMRLAGEAWKTAAN